LPIGNAISDTHQTGSTSTAMQQVHPVGQLNERAHDPGVSQLKRFPLDSLLWTRQSEAWMPILDFVRAQSPSDFSA
jgi:hypothetical protein